MVSRPAGFNTSDGGASDAVCLARRPLLVMAALKRAPEMTSHAGLFATSVFLAFIAVEAAGSGTAVPGTNAWTPVIKPSPPFPSKTRTAPLIQTGAGPLVAEHFNQQNMELLTLMQRLEVRFGMEISTSSIRGMKILQNRY